MSRAAIFRVIARSSCFLSFTKTRLFRVGREKYKEGCSAQELCCHCSLALLRRPEVTWVDSSSSSPVLWSELRKSIASAPPVQKTSGFWCWLASPPHHLQEAVLVLRVCIAMSLKCHHTSQMSVFVITGDF